MSRHVFAAAMSLVLVCGALVAAASAADHVVGGKQLTLRRQGSGGALSLVLRDPSIPIPAPGSADDPSLAGMTVTLFGRASEEQASLAAAPGLGRPGWKVRATPRVTYTYTNPTAAVGSGSLASVTLRAGTGLTVRAKSPGLALAVPAGAVAVRIDMGATRVCALFDGDAVRRDQVGSFVARNADASGLTDCDDATLIALSCEDSQSCGGTCPGDAVCAAQPSGEGGCSCVSPHQPCGDTSPACNGECPVGEECSNLGGVLHTSCACMPAGSTACGGVYPSCGDGDCPPGRSCGIDYFELQPGSGAYTEWCACRIGPPSPCPGGCPEGWICFQGSCLPPFCDGDGQSCGGTCTQPGTVCTAQIGFCFCLTPCSGGDAFPTCGGSCDPGLSCSALDGACICMP